MRTYYRFTTWLLSASLFFTACNSNHSNKTAGGKDSLEIMTRPTQSASEVKIFRSNNVAEEQLNAPITTVVIHEMKGYGQDTTFARQAADLLQKVINSPDFKNTVLNNSYHENNGLSSQQIYDLLMQAHEPVGPGGADHVVDLYLRVISEEEDGEVWMRNCEPGSSTGTIGIDGAGTGIAAVCPQWLRSTAEQRKPSWLAAHFIHEYMHILEFRHYHSKPKSVPYKIQYIVEQLGEQYDPADSTLHP